MTEVAGWASPTKIDANYSLEDIIRRHQAGIDIQRGGQVFCGDRKILVHTADLLLGRIFSPFKAATLPTPGIVIVGGCQVGLIGLRISTDPFVQKRCICRHGYIKRVIRVMKPKFMGIILPPEVSAISSKTMSMAIEGMSERSGI
jgi:hypothetical protein